MWIISVNLSSTPEARSKTIMSYKVPTWKFAAKHDPAIGVTPVFTPTQSFRDNYIQNTIYKFISVVPHHLTGLLHTLV